MTPFRIPSGSSSHQVRDPDLVLQLPAICLSDLFLSPITVSDSFRPLLCLTQPLEFTQSSLAVAGEAMLVDKYQLHGGARRRIIS